MLLFNLLTLSAIAGIASAQVADIPPCALSCFEQGIGNSTCGLTDTYCQCTNPEKDVIASVTARCLCSSTCTPSELYLAAVASDNICVAALIVSSQIFTPATINLSSPCSQGTAAGTGTSVPTTSATTTASSSANGVGASTTTGPLASSTANAASTTTSSPSGAAVTAQSGGNHFLLEAAAIAFLAL